MHFRISAQVRAQVRQGLGREEVSCEDSHAGSFSFERVRKYRVIDFGRTKRDMFGTIQTIEYDPYRNARICLVEYEVGGARKETEPKDGEKRYILHAVGYFVGQEADPPGQESSRRCLESLVRSLPGDLFC